VKVWSNFVIAGGAVCVLAQGCAAPGGNSARVAVDAPVSAAGAPNAPSLTASQRAELDAAIARAKPDARGHLRYAIAKDDSGRSRLAVYDPGAVAPAHHRRDQTVVYVVYRLLNAKDGASYDPQQDAIVEALPIPVDRLTDPATPRT
jgi:hypothetical protein